MKTMIKFIPYILTVFLLALPFIMAALTQGPPPALFSKMLSFMQIYTAVTIPLLLYTLLSIVGRLIGLVCRLASSGNFRITCYTEGFAITIGAIAFVLMIIGHWWGPTHLIKKEITVESEKLPAAFNGYKIVQFTDLHLASQQNQPEFVQELVDTINAQNADAICFTGDLVTLDRNELTPFSSVLSQLKAKDGVFSVLGNHDYHQYVRYQSATEKKQAIEQFKQDERNMGWKLLLNESTIINRGNDSICLGGSENDGNGVHFPQYGDLPKTFKDRDSVACKILLSHDPTHWRRKILPESNERDIMLTLSGHTHGMQTMLFGWSPSSWIYQDWGGLVQEGSHYLNVSLGVGGAGLPFRIGAWPEICVITLKCKK